MVPRKRCLQNKNHSYFVFSRRAWGGGGKLNCLKNSESWRFILVFVGNKSLTCELFKSKVGGEDGSFSVGSKKKKL